MIFEADVRGKAALDRTRRREEKRKRGPRLRRMSSTPMGKQRGLGSKLRKLPLRPEDRNFGTRLDDDKVHSEKRSCFNGIDLREEPNGSRA